MFLALRVLVEQILPTWVINLGVNNKAAEATKER